MPKKVFVPIKKDEKKEFSAGKNPVVFDSKKKWVFFPKKDDTIEQAEKFLNDTRYTTKGIVKEFFPDDKERWNMTLTATQAAFIRDSKQASADSSKESSSAAPHVRAPSPGKS